MQSVSSEEYIEPNEVDDSGIFLVSVAIKGGKDEFISLIDMYESYLYKMAFLYVKNEHEALDIYQETIYSAYISISKLKNPRFFKTWITRILINNAKRKLKHIGKRELLLEGEMIEGVYEDNDSVAIEEKIDLYNAIDSLEERYKTPIVLKYFQDMSIREISEVLSCPENTVKSYIRRAKALLLKSLKEDM